MLKQKNKAIKILIVEDEGIVAKDLEQMLVGMGYKVVAKLAYGEKVLDFVNKKKPDIILMDIVLKGKIDGIEAARKIHSLYGIPSIFLTAHADEKKIEKAKSAQPFGYILKPFQKMELEVVIEMALERLSVEKNTKKENAKHRKMEEELEKLSERQKSILSTVPDILMEVDSQKIYTWANRAGYDFFGKDVIGKKAVHYFVGSQKTYKTVQPIFSGKERTIYLESWQRRKDGQNRLLAWWCRPLKNKEGNVVGALSSAQDITERRYTEDSLKASETRYRRLFESAKDGILILDYETGKVVNVNPFLTEMMGLSKEKFIGKPLWELGLFKDIAKNKSNYLKLKRKKYIRYEDLPLVTAYGQKINVEFISNVYGVDHQKVVQCNIRDITERRYIEDSLKASEIRYRRLFESAKDGILILDYETGKVVDVNPFLIQILGQPKDKFVGKQLWELGFFKDIVENKLNYLELKRKKYIRYEDLPLETAYGQKINVEFVSNVYEVNHEKVIQCNIRDITERKKAAEALQKSEKRYHDIFEASLDALMLLDKKGFFDCNQATLKMFGYKTVKEFCKKHPGKVSPPHQPDGTPSIKMANARIEEAYKKGSSMFEWTHRRKNGEDFIASVLLVSFDIESRKVLQATVRDITQQKKIEQSKMELVSLASHQLRTPPTAVKWFANMLLDGDVGKLNKKQRAYLNEIIFNNQRMIDLVRSLLSVSRIELGTFLSNLKLKRMQITKVIDSLLGEFRAPIDDKKLVIIKNYGKGLPAIQTDQGLLKIVLNNLISNTVQYTSHGDTIKLTVKKQKSDIIVTISDTGVGIPKYQQKKIFSIFFRADNAAAKDADGSGLGLYVTKKIVDEMGGSIGFKSTLNKGTTFCLSIPIRSKIKPID